MTDTRKSHECSAPRVRLNSSGAPEPGVKYVYTAEELRETALHLMKTTHAVLGRVGKHVGVLAGDLLRIADQVDAGATRGSLANGASWEPVLVVAIEAAPD